MCRDHEYLAADPQNLHKHDQGRELIAISILWLTSHNNIDMKQSHYRRIYHRNERDTCTCLYKMVNAIHEAGLEHD